MSGSTDSSADPVAPVAPGALGDAGEASAPLVVGSGSLGTDEQPTARVERAATAASVVRLMR